MTNMQHAASSSSETNLTTPSQAHVPVWLFVLLGVLGYWGMRYLDMTGGGFNPKVYDPYPTFAYVEALVPKSDADALFASGQKVYTTYCAVCHQPTGTGIAGQFPPLAGSDWVNVDGPNRMIRLALDGIQGPITVSGQAYNGAMPPWRDLLKDEEIAAVLTYVRGNAAWGNTASPVNAEEVKAVRESTAGRSTSWGPAELLALPAK
jgi:mono/diheme cytochrome c family protein